MANVLKTRLLREIAGAFPLFPVPGDHDLVDDVTGDDERSDIRRAFTGKSWNMISAEVLQQESEALMFFKPRGPTIYPRS